MADQHGNPFLLEEPKRTPASKEYDPLTTKQAGTNDLNASIEQMEPESVTEFSAIKREHGFIPSKGQVEPGTHSQMQARATNTMS